MLASIKRTYTLIKTILFRFQEDKAFKHGAAISYYTVFSLPAILLIIIHLTGAFLGEEQVKGEIMLQIENLIGPETAQQVGDMISSLNQERNTIWATLIGLGTLIFGATGVFYTLTDTINTIWKLPNKLEGGGFLKLIADRVLSLAMILTMGFILMVSMILETVIVALKNVIERLETSFIEAISEWVPNFGKIIQQIDVIFFVALAIDLVVGLSVITLIFAMLFRFLPSARIPWKDAFLGGFITAVLFNIGKALIGWYIGNSNIASTYGAAGSIVLILLWVFYSSQILLVGAEFIFVYTLSQGREIRPARFVERLTDRPWLRLRLMIRRWQRRRKRAEKARKRQEAKAKAAPPDQREDPVQKSS
jgi:membrane protein